MIFRDLIQSGIRTANTNAPALLTAFGAVGVVSTSVLTARASFKAADTLREAKLDRAQALADRDGSINDGNKAELDLDRFETVKLVWPLYIGAASTGAITVAAVIMSHRVSARRAAALAAAYTMSEGRLEEYQEKIKEKFGVKDEKAVRSEINQDKVNEKYKEGTVIFSPTDGKHLIREEYTGRTFWSTIDEINKAVNEVNAQINQIGSIRMSDFYDAIDLEHVSTSDYFGWTHDDRLELEWDTSTTPDGKTAIHTFEYVNHPVMNPEREAGPFR